jgi:hypothetical protein
MKIALFSRSIYPRTGGSAYVIEELVKNFSPSDAIVIGGKDFFFFKKYKRAATSVSFYYLNTQLSIKGRGERFFDPIRWLLLPYSIIKSIYLVKKEKCNYILAVFPDAYFLLLAWCVSKIVGLPMSSYFHNTYLENRTGWNRTVATWIQKKIFQRSDYIFVMSEGMQKYYQNNYTDSHKFTPLVHTFNVYPEVSTWKFEEQKKHWNLAFIGNFNQSNMDATIRVVDALKEDKRFTLNFYTPVPKLLLSMRGIDTEGLNYIGYIRDEDFYNRLQENDLLVLTHGFEGGYSDFEYKTIFPTRSIPFLLSKRPIVIHAPSDSFLSQLFIQHQAAEVISEKGKEFIVKGIEKIIQSKEHTFALLANADAMSKLFYGPEVVANLKKLIHSKIRA